MRKPANRIKKLIRNKIPFIIGATTVYDQADLWVAIMHRDRDGVKWNYRKGSMVFFEPNPEERFVLRALITTHELVQSHRSEAGMIYEHRRLPFKPHYHRKAAA
jgi:hypothetical protein